MNRLAIVLMSFPSDRSAGDILVEDADTRRLYFNALATCYCLRTRCIYQLSGLVLASYELWQLLVQLTLSPKPKPRNLNP